jgi:uncharacterized protein
MSTTGMRVVIDTNVLVAAIGRKSPFRWIFDAIIDGRLILCVSNEIVMEYKEILQNKASREVASNFIDFLTIHPYVEKAEPFFNFSLITEDADDNKFVDCAIAAGAFCIVTNDKHFLVLKTIEFPKVRVLSIEEFDKSYRRYLTG